MDDSQIIAKSHRAFHEFTEVAEAFDKVEAAIVKTLGETPVGADAKILRLHMSLQNLAAVRHAIREVIDSGRMAEAAIAQAGLTRVA